MGTSMQAATRTAGNATDFEAAWQAAEDGDVIQLTNDVAITKTLWLGTANMNDAAKSITLDLNGFILTNAENNLAYMFVITHGELNVIGNGQIKQTGSKAQEVFRLTGSSYKNVNPKTAASGYYSHLTIGEGVFVDAKLNGIAIDEIANVTFGSTGKDANKYYYLHADYALATAGETPVSTMPSNLSTRMFKSSSAATSANRGLANGVRVDVYGKIEVSATGKYAIKANGNLAGPSNPAADNISSFWADPEETIAYAKEDGDEAYAPFIHIYSSADLRAPASNGSSKMPVSVYCSGYARWMIEGTCVGATGVYVKSGDVDIHNANIQSTATTYQAASSTNSGVTGAGSALVIESSKVYAGDIDVDISGDSKLSATSGYAIDESITYDASYNAGESKVNTITISGGTFEGGAAGVMTVCEQTAAEAASTVDETTITIIGGQANQGAATIGNQTLADYLSQQAESTHLTYVDNGQGGTTVVISQGDGPTPVATWAAIEALSDALNPVDVEWQAIENANMSHATIYLGELQINSGSANNLQQLTIPSDGVLQVEHLLMNAYARIIVEAGGKLIVTGAQGIVAPVADNILLKTSETAQAILLFKPEVSSNRHPNATVELYSKAYCKGNEQYVWQRFGVPTYNDDLKRTDIGYDHSAAPTAWRKIDHQEWVVFPATEGLKPFVCYGLTTTATSAIGVYEFKCPLMGNDNATLALTDEWNYYANSYMAPININAMFAIMQGAVEGTMYLYNPENNWWYEINKATYFFHNELPREVNPMQAFVFHRRAAGADPVLNYANHIWNPIMNPAGAPARNINSINKAMVEIAAADGTKDCVRMIEDAQFSADFDNSYDASKYMNENSFNLFAGEQLGIIATDNLEGTALTLTTKDQTSFTMTISQVNGMDYAIRDNLTGTEIAMVEGATYMFSVPANSTVEGRFEIVPMAKMPTAIENIEEAAAVKGIYSVSGQFLGNDYHSLPNGVYVVDGKKIVK